MADEKTVCGYSLMGEEVFSHLPRHFFEGRDGMNDIVPCSRHGIGHVFGAEFHVGQIDVHPTVEMAEDGNTLVTTGVIDDRAREPLVAGKHKTSEDVDDLRGGGYEIDIMAAALGQGKHERGEFHGAYHPTCKGVTDLVILTKRQRKLQEEKNMVPEPPVPERGGSSP